MRCPLMAITDRYHLHMNVHHSLDKILSQKYFQLFISLPGVHICCPVWLAKITTPIRFPDNYTMRSIIVCILLSCMLCWAIQHPIHDLWAGTASIQPALGVIFIQMKTFLVNRKDVMDGMSWESFGLYIWKFNKSSSNSFHTRIIIIIIVMGLGIFVYGPSITIVYGLHSTS